VPENPSAIEFNGGHVQFDHGVHADGEVVINNIFIAEGDDFSLVNALLLGVAAFIAWVVFPSPRR
jgi:hypothetical protein